MLTPTQFTNLLRIRRETQTLAAIGRELGVTHAAVQRWLSGSRKPTHTVLMLAERVWAGPREMAPGLPAGDANEEAS